MNSGIYVNEDFRDWHKNYHKEEKDFYMNLIMKITDGTDIEINENKEIDPKHEFLAAGAFLHGMMNFITYAEELDLVDLTETDIAKVINIFLTGLCPVDFGVAKSEHHNNSEQAEKISN